MTETKLLGIQHLVLTLLSAILGFVTLFMYFSIPALCASGFFCVAGWTGYIAYFCLSPFGELLEEPTLPLPTEEEIKRLKELQDAEHQKKLRDLGYEDPNKEPPKPPRF